MGKLESMPSMHEAALPGQRIRLHIYILATSFQHGRVGKCSSTSPTHSICAHLLDMMLDDDGLSSYGLALLGAGMRNFVLSA